MKYVSSIDSQEEDDLRFYREARKSNECFCERGKQHGMWFCYRCYKSLPADMRRALFGKMNKDMMGAYDTAIRYLSD